MHPLEVTVEQGSIFDIMQRNIHALAQGEFDLLIIGCGAFGAAAAREAALRGLRTAVIDRGDFGGATSAECFKMVHGGIRYLQHADVRRLRSSCHERSTLLRIAPHLVQPLPIAIPTYGHARQSRWFLGAGACVYDLLTLDRNAAIADPNRRIRRTRLLSRSELLAVFPHLERDDLTGAVVFQDGQMYNPARLVLAFVQAAVLGGAVACNYVAAESFLWEGDRVRGVRARDRLSEETFEIRAQLTLNAAGPWADYLQQDPARFGKHVRQPFSRDAYFIVDRPPSSSLAVAVQGLSRDRDAVLSRSARHLFAVPWRNKMLFGVWHCLFPDVPDSARVEYAEIERWMAELNTVYPALKLTLDEVSFANCGLVPFGETATETELSFGKQSRLIDHRTHGIGGLVSLVGIRYTTARGDAARALDILLQQHPSPAVRRLRVRTASESAPLPGGDIENFERFEARARQTCPSFVRHDTLSALLRNHGCAYERVLRRAQHDSSSKRFVATSNTLLAEIAHAVDEEMAVRLEDVVMRRTDLAAGHHPGRPALESAAQEMARRLGWSEERTAEEVRVTDEVLRRHLARPVHGLTTPIRAVPGGSAAPVKIPA